MGSYNEYKDEMEDNNDYVDYTDDNCNNNDENGDEDSTCRRLLAKSSQSRQGRRERLLFNGLMASALRLIIVTIRCHHHYHYH